MPLFNPLNSQIANATSKNPPVGADSLGLVDSVTGLLANLTLTNLATWLSTVVSAVKWNTARLLAGNSVDGSADVAFANKFIVQGTADSGLSAAQFLGALATGIVKNTNATGILTIAIAADFPTLNQNTSGSAATLTTARLIYGNSFNGSADLAQIIASTFGGTGNGFTKFSGPTTAERTKTLRDASDTILELGGTYTPTGVWTWANGKMLFSGSTSGNTTLQATAIAGTTTLTLPAATDTLVGKATTDTLTNKTFDTAGAGNSFSINGVAATANQGTGAVVRATSPALVTPDIGVATGTSLAVTGALKSSGTAGIGYATGAGGTVTQATSKSTGVTLNKLCGQITTNNEALAAGASNAFTVTNTLVASTDVVTPNHIGGGNIRDYQWWVQPVAGSFTVYFKNLSAGSLSDALVLNFVVTKGVNA